MERLPGVKLISVSDASPHNQAIYEAGKALMIESVTTARDFCKFMITTSTSAIPVYISIMAFLLPEDYVLDVVNGLVVSLPAAIFLLSTIAFTVGYFPVSTTLRLDIIEEIEHERLRTIRRRRRVITAGFTLFVFGILMGIVVVVANLGVG